MSFRDVLRSKEFVITVELPLTPATTKKSLLTDADLLRASVDGFLLTDNQYGQPHMAPAFAAGILKQNGLSPVLQISTRNRNRIALIGELLGARATGLDTLIMVRGAILPEGYEPRPGAVMDTDAKDLIATAKLINEDENFAPGDNILIGTSATVHDPSPDTKPGELLAKADAGAQLVVTQICLDCDVLRRYLDFLVRHKLVQRLSVVVSIAAITSNEVALWLRENRPGTIIPDEYVEHLRTAKGGESAAIKYTSDLLKEIQSIPGVAGINFAAVGDLEIVSAIIAAAGIEH